MADRTASKRVQKYRLAQRDREITRLDLQVPATLAHEAKSTAHRWRANFAALNEARKPVDFVLGTINAPRPRHIDGRTLLSCLLASEPVPEWRPHIEALIDEVSPEALHDLVLNGVIDFENLYRATRVWKAHHARNAEWIREMADLSLGEPAPLSSQPS